MGSSITNRRIPFGALITIAATLLSCYSFIPKVEGVIGINWGRQTSHRMIPSMVVDLLLQNDIRHLKIFSPSDNVLKAFANSNISITVTLPNEMLKFIKYPSVVNYWMQENILRHRNNNINITCLHVGAEPFSTYAREKTYSIAPDTLKLVQDSILANNYTVVLTMSHFTDVLTVVDKPSEADFRPEIRDKMVEVIRILNRTNSPFVMNMFPIYSVVKREGWTTEFSFVDNKSGFSIKDNGLIYRNAFEFYYDSFLHAIRKAGAPNMQLQVGKIGWPTDGYEGANIANAERFYRKFLPYIRSNKGTPLRPGISIDIFIHTISDENRNSVSIAAFQRHWGIYWSNGQPKYKIDFTGQGRDIYPTTAKGIILMPKRWCIFNNDTSNLAVVRSSFEEACGEADCTALAPGGSCSHLDFNQNVSYAYNMMFQASAQSDSKGQSCDFGGTGMLVPYDPSLGTCKFPVEMLAAEKADKDGVSSGGVRGRKGNVLGWALLLVFFFGMINVL